MTKKGSALLWIIIGSLFLGLLAGVLYFWGRTFLFTSGLDSTQIDTYEKAIDQTNQIKKTVEEKNQNNIYDNYPR